MIWIHAVSVGEVEACQPLVMTLQSRFPGHHIHITTMTPTGRARVTRLYADTVSYSYLPYDLPFAIKRFYRHIHPHFGILMETEIWPNLITYFHHQSTPLFLANARMSTRSAKGYAHFQSFTQSILQKLSLIAVQCQDDKQRMLSLGATAGNVHVVGNLKYELRIPEGTAEQAKRMRSLWGTQRPVWIAASTHEGEERLIIQASRAVRARFPELLVVIVPRHPERFDQVVALAQKAGYKTLRRSEHRPCSSDVQILVVDTMGELPLFYAASDLVFIGGSLVPHGGHNLLEPAVLGKAIMTGPHYFNFAEITQQFLAHNAIVQVNDMESLITTSITLLEQEEERQRMGNIGQQLIRQNQGASNRLVNLIQNYLTHRAD